MRLILVPMCIALVLSWSQWAEAKYDYRTSSAYAALSKEQKENLNRVHRDFVLLWGALDMYADEHESHMPQSLDELVPHYLHELPRDPFATKETAKERPKYYVPSDKGHGYRYQPGASDSFVVCSVGLPGFPYLGEHDNVDLYIVKGIWSGGGEFVR